MATKLKIDNNFTPCPAIAGDEMRANGIFVFNITKMSEYIKNNLDSIMLQKITVKDFLESFLSINESHMETVDISQPIILAEIAPDQHNVLDGNHRMEKARRAGIKHLPAYKLNVNQHLQFLIDKTAYISYVEYWNSKLK